MLKMFEGYFFLRLFKRIDLLKNAILLTIPPSNFFIIQYKTILILNLSYIEFDLLFLLLKQTSYPILYQIILISKTISNLQHSHSNSYPLTIFNYEIIIWIKYILQLYLLFIELFGFPIYLQGSVWWCVLLIILILIFYHNFILTKNILILI